MFIITSNTHTPPYTHARKIMSARRPADRRKVQTQAKDAAVAAASSGPALTSGQ